MSAARDSLAQRHSTKHTAFYTPYFKKPIWACSPDADTLAPPIIGMGKMSSGSGTISEPKALRVEDTSALPQTTRSYVADHSHLVQQAAVPPHDAKACSTLTVLQKLRFVPFAVASDSTAAQGNFGNVSSGSGAPNPINHCMDDMVISSPAPGVTSHTHESSNDIILRKSLPLLPPGLGHDLAISSVEHPAYISMGASSGTTGNSGTEGLLVQWGFDGIARVTSASDIPELAGRSAIPCVITPKTPDMKAIVDAFCGLSAHFMYSLAIKASADEVFPDPQLDGRNYVTSVVATRIRFILEYVKNPQVVAIHALWYISKITTSDISRGHDFLGVSVFNHLHCLGFSSLDDILFAAFIIAARLADKWANDSCLSGKTWEDITTIPFTTFNNVERTALTSLDYLVNIPRNALHNFMLTLRASSSHLSDCNSAVIHRILDGVLALNESTEINTAFVRYQGRKKKAPRRAPPVIHAPIPVKPLTCLPDPNDWCPEADPIVNKHPRTIGIAPGSDNFGPDLRQATTALELLELITQGKGAGLRSWGATVGGPLSTIGARLAHTVGRYGPCQTTIG